MLQLFVENVTTCILLLIGTTFSIKHIYIILLSTECKHIPLISGSKNRVCDSDLTASSEFPISVFDHRPSLSRLHTKAVDGKSAGSWSAHHNQINQWIQVRKYK